MNKRRAMSPPQFYLMDSERIYLKYREFLEDS